MEISTATPNEDIDVKPKFIKSKLGICEVCGGECAKYTCPKCEVKTCSLSCTKIHKSELKCDGQINRAKFITLKNFTDFDLSNDYRFLEQTTRFVELTKKQRGPTVNNLPSWCLRLVADARRKKVHLKLLPNMFSRHRKNKTRLNYTTKQIEWQVEWRFPNANNWSETDRLPESIKLASAINPYLDEAKNHSFLNEKLQYYQAAGLQGIKLLLRAEQQKCKWRFHILDSSLTLAENLQNKVIIEFPIIYVVFNDDVFSYDLIDSDDEDGLKDIRRYGNIVVNRIVKQEEDEDTKSKNAVNFFFNTDLHIKDEPNDSDDD